VREYVLKTEFNYKLDSVKKTVGVLSNFFKDVDVLIFPAAKDVGVLTFVPKDVGVLTFVFCFPKDVGVLTFVFLTFVSQPIDQVTAVEQYFVPHHTVVDQHFDISVIHPRLDHQVHAVEGKGQDEFS
jgi:hypothetical protein